MRTLVKKSSLFPSFPPLFDDLFAKDLFDWPHKHTTEGHTAPAINIKETGDAYELEVAAPGMSKKDFEVTLDHDLLMISAKKEEKAEEKDAEGSYNRREFSYRGFSRSFTLPENTIENEKVEATYTDGILLVTVPKMEEAKPKPVRQIAIG